MKAMPLIQSIKVHILPIVILLGVICAFFYPQLQGKKIEAGDAISSTAWSSEVTAFAKETGKTYRWNGAIFSGMPWGLLGLGADRNLLRPLDSAARLGVSPALGIMLKAGLFAYLALILLGVGPWASLLGALFFSLNLNYIVLMEAGHQSKVNVLADCPLILAGFLLCYRQRHLLGATTIAFATSLAILNNHIQMVYYLLLCLVVIGFVFLLQAIREKETKRFFIASAFALGGAALGGLSNFAQLYSSQSFSDDTMRGKPILASAASAAPTSSSEVDGLDWNYAMGWSNQFVDVMSIFIPSIAGGSNGEKIDGKSQLARLFRANGATPDSNGKISVPLYWGPLPFTSGPYYMGAIILLLFIFSLLILDGPLRWGLIGASLLIVLLSMGRHAAWLNQLLFDSLPLFNKFRTPNSVINILPIFMVIPIGLALQKIASTVDRKKLVRPLLFASGATALIYLVFGVGGSMFFDFLGAREANYQPEVQQLFVEERQSMASNDALRSLVFVVLGAGLMIIYLYTNKIKPWVVAIGLAVLTLADAWPINRRYLDADNYANAVEYEAAFTPRPADVQILAAETKGRGYYRVLDRSIDTYNSAHTSYHHNTIGGYHPAKLQRYDDVKTRLLIPGDQEVINMLNGKYIIQQDGSLQRNPGALGSAWFVNEIQYVNSPEEEIASTATIDPATTAVVLQSEFSDQAANLQAGDGAGSISLEEYEPDRLVYKYECASDQLAVFSEVWYGPGKGWEITINGEPAEMIRANYILRALQVPAGQGEIIFEFNPKPVGGAISIIASLGILGLCFLGMFRSFKNLPEAEQEAVADIAEEEMIKPVKKTVARKVRKTTAKAKGKKKK